MVEVLSPSTAAYDRGEKFRLYRACATIQEYMLINTKEPYVELFRREKGDIWTLHSFEKEDVVRLASLDIEMPVMELYKNVQFVEDENA